MNMLLMLAQDASVHAANSKTFWEVWAQPLASVVTAIVALLGIWLTFRVGKNSLTNTLAAQYYKSVDESKRDRQAAVRAAKIKALEDLRKEYKEWAGALCRHNKCRSGFYSAHVVYKNKIVARLRAKSLRQSQLLLDLAFSSLVLRELNEERKELTRAIIKNIYDLSEIRHGGDKELMKETIEKAEMSLVSTLGDILPLIGASIQTEIEALEAASVNDQSVALETDSKPKFWFWPFS